MHIAQLEDSGLEVNALQAWFEDQIPELISLFWSVVIAIIVWIVGVKLSSMLRKMVVKALEIRDIDTGIVQFVNAFLKYFGYFVLLIFILNIFGITTTSIAAAVASLGVTAGLALQGSLSNFAGGLLILLLKPFKVGDYITEDTHGNEGTVSEISVFYTKLKTTDNKVIVIPNGVLANASMTNSTYSDTRMINITVPISYDDDIRTAKNLLTHLIEQENRCIKEEPIKVFVSDFGESSINLGIRFWVKTSDYWDVRWNLLENVKYTFDEHGITIPLNQLDIQMRQEK